MATNQFGRQSTRPKHLFFLVQWTEEDSHSIVSGKDLDKNESVIKDGDEVKARVRRGNGTEWFKAKVIARGDKWEMERVQDELESDDVCAGSPPAKHPKKSTTPEFQQFEVTQGSKHTLKKSAASRKISTPKKGKNKKKESAPAKSKEKARAMASTIASSQLLDSLNISRSPSLQLIASPSPSDVSYNKNYPPTSFSGPSKVPGSFSGPSNDPAFSSGPSNSPPKPCDNTSKPADRLSNNPPRSSNPPSPLNNQNSPGHSPDHQQHKPIQSKDCYRTELDSPVPSWTSPPHNWDHEPPPLFRRSSSDTKPKRGYSSETAPSGWQLHCPPGITPPFFVSPSTSYSPHYYTPPHVYDRFASSSHEVTPASDYTAENRELREMLITLQQQVNSGLSSLYTKMSELSEQMKTKNRKKSKASDSGILSVSSSVSSPHHGESSLMQDEGCWFGDPNTSVRELKAWVTNTNEADLRAVDCQLKCRDLCRKLTELLFTEEELAGGNATEARTAGVTLLDAHRLYAIRVHCLYRFPIEGGLNNSTGKERWKNLKQTIINSICRELRRKIKN